VSLFLLGGGIVFLPLLLPSGPGNSAMVDLFAVCYILAVLAGLLRSGRPLRWPAGAALALIVLASLIALVASANPSKGLLNLVIDLYLFALFLVICNDLAGRERALQAVLKVWVVAALAWGTLLILTSLHALPPELAKALVGQTFEDRLATTTGNPNLAASFMLVSYFVALSSRWPRRRLARFLVSGWILFGMYVTGSNGALAGVLAGWAFLAVGHHLRAARTREQVMATVGGGLLLLTVALGVAVTLVGVPRLGLADVSQLAAREQDGAFAANLGRLDRGTRTRLQLWDSGFRGAGSRLAVGIGPGEAIDVVVNAKGKKQSLHNDFIAYLIERGILGLAGILALYAALLRWGGRLLLAPGRGPATMRGLGAGVAANLVMSISHETMHFRHAWVLFALCWVAATVVAGRRHAATATATAAAAGAPPTRPGRAPAGRRLSNA
jgi:O-antigen ligase